MVRLYSLLSLLTILFFSVGVGFSQCQDCIPDTNCSSPDGMPSVCPNELDDATAGEYYSSIATFYMPSNIEVDGIEASLISVSLASMTGVPFGLEIVPNNATGVYFPSSGENHGCVTICGTPLVAGEYSVELTVDVIASAFGFEVPVTESFSLPFTVLEGETSNASFSASTFSGCSPLEVDLINTINGPGTTYLWDLDGYGLGTDLTSSNPSVLFSEPGEYDISLVTTVTELVLTQLEIVSLSGGWSGDPEELFWGSPDPFFNINGDGIDFTSAAIDENETPTFSGLNIPLAYGSEYSVSFYDEDLISANDYLGNAIFIASAPGEYTINGGGNTAIITIAESISAQFEDTETIVVYDYIDAYLDVDEDGYGNSEYPVNGCDPELEYSVAFNGQDCNDEDATMYPGAVGTFSGIDNDCNTIVEFDEEIPIYGCADEGACNYDIEANSDDGSCEYESCSGCTDPLAINYNPEALIPDNSCEYLECFGDFNNDGAITVADLLILLASFGCEGDCNTDLTNDDVVSVADLLEILAVYGTQCE